MKNGKSLDPTNLVEATLWHRTVETLYDVLHNDPNKGLLETQRGTKACMATLILINQKRKMSGQPFPYPIIVVFPRNT